MKFFESKHYVTMQTYPPKPERASFEPLLLQEWNKNNRRRDLAIVNEPGKNLTRQVLNHFCTRLPLIPDYRVPREKIESNWIPVTDLTHLKAQGVEDIVDSDFTDAFVYVYYHEKSQLFVLLNISKENQENYDFIHTVHLYCPFDVDQTLAIDALCADSSLIPYTRIRKPEMCVLTKSGSNFSFRYTTLKSVAIDFDTMYPAEFKEVSKELVKYVNDKESTGLVILHGEPGTGKTNYLRWLTEQSSRTMVFIPPEMVTHLTSPDFVTFLLRNTGLTFIVEDAEATLTPRMGSEKSIVSTILNLTDGLMGDVLRCQFICTFNTPLTNIDSALLRPGRLLIRQEFRKLNVEESNRYLASVNSTIRVSEFTSLAELTNIEAPPIVSKQETTKSFGFNNN